MADKEEDFHSEGEANGDSGDDGSKKEEKKPVTMKELIMRIGMIGNLGMQAVNIALAETRGGPITKLGTTKAVGRGMIYGSSGIGAANSPVVIYKERQLTQEDTFRNALNGIREQQGRLSGQNDILSAEIDDLQSDVDRMKDVQEALGGLAETQGSQLDELMELIEENKQINLALRSVLKSKALEEVITLVLDIDNDGSFTIQDKEVDRLIIGMKLLEDITFNESMFREEVIACGGNVDEVIALIKKMIHGRDGCEGEEEDGDRCTIDIDQDPEEWFKKQRSKTA
jgi:restriction endonuclease S subunit